MAQSLSAATEPIWTKFREVVSSVRWDWSSNLTPKSPHLIISASGFVFVVLRNSDPAFTCLFFFSTKSPSFAKSFEKKHDVQQPSGMRGHLFYERNDISGRSLTLQNKNFLEIKEKSKLLHQDTKTWEWGVKLQ